MFFQTSDSIQFLKNAFFVVYFFIRLAMIFETVGQCHEQKNLLPVYSNWSRVAGVNDSENGDKSSPGSLMPANGEYSGKGQQLPSAVEEQLVKNKL